MAFSHAVVMVKSFTYRDAAEEWSNRYHLLGTAPSDATGWKNLYDAIWALEAPLLPTRVTLVKAYGYLTDDTASVDSHDYHVGGSPPAGTLGFDLSPAPGDAAMVVSWKIARRSSKGKPIYLRKYFHGVDEASGEIDQVNTTQLTHLNSYATAMLSTIGATASFMCGPQGDVPISGAGSKWITTRTLKRRGKRPPT